jgi:hypothetical protein
LLLKNGGLLTRHFFFAHSLPLGRESSDGRKSQIQTVETVVGVSAPVLKAITLLKEALNKLIPFMVRQAHHERNQQLTVRPEPVEGLIQSFLNGSNPGKGK